MSVTHFKRAHGSMDSVEPNAKRSRLQLMRLPREVLERIFYKVECPLRLIRPSKNMRDLYTDYIMHWHRCFEHSYRQQPQEGFREPVVRAVLKVLSVATEYSVRCCYESHLGINLASLHVVISASANMNTTSHHLRQLMRKFFLSLEKPLGSPKVLHWHLEVEVQGTFLGVLVPVKGYPRPLGLNQHIDIVGLITEMLLHDQLKRDFVSMKYLGACIYKYRLSLKNKLEDRLVLKFWVLAPKSIIHLLQKAIAGDTDLTDSLHMPPNSGCQKGKINENDII